MFKNISLLVLLSLVFCQGFSQKVDRRKIDNLTALAKLYGYIRYFHPSDESNKIGWNKFSRYSVNEVMNAGNEDELLSKLKELFYPIAPSLELYNSKTKSAFTKDKLIPPDTTGWKTIAFQYKGFYHDVRINRPPWPIPSSPSATIRQSLTGSGYAGKEIKLTGWMKIIPGKEDGTGHLWLRVDKEKGVGFFDNMDGRAAIDTVWKKYEIIGKVDDDAKKIYFGGFLKGYGQLYIDNIELMIKENGNWISADIKNGSFEQISDDLPNDWTLPLLKDSIYKYTISTDAVSGNSCLTILRVEEDIYAKPSKPIFDSIPPAGMTVTKQIAKNITAVIPISLYGNETNTYPAADRNKLNELIGKINLVNQKISGDSLNVRLGNVVIAWNIFKHFFPYWEDASETPNEILRKAVTRSFHDKTATDFKYTLRLMTNPLNDGHINVNLDGDTTERYTVALLPEYAEGKLVIEKVLDSTLSNKIKQGDIITKINGITSDKFINEAEKYLSGSTQFKHSRSKLYLLRGSRNSTIRIILNDSQTFDLVRNIDLGLFYNKSKVRKKTGWIKESIYYVDLDAEPWDSINKRMPELQKAKAIIFDLRGYPNSNHKVINHLLKTKESDSWMFIPDIIYPDYQPIKYEKFGWNLEPKEPHLSGKIYFLTDGRAISYAESFMGFIKDLNLATIIGGPTAGTNGNTTSFNLPGDYRIFFTGMLVKNHDGSKHHLIGIVPHVNVYRTIKGIVEGRDEILEKAIELAEKEN